MQSVPFPVPERTPEQIASGAIVVGMGGQVRRLPVLPIEPNEAWTALFTETIARTLADMPELDSLSDVSQVAAGSLDRMVDLLVAYDAQGALGGREWIRSHATPGEVYDALKQVVSAAFPFGIDLVKFAPELRLLLIETIAESASSASMKPSPKRTGGRRARSARS